MLKNSIKRKQLRRKFQRRAAALAGAAILTGTALAGLPVTKAEAAKAPVNPWDLKTEQTVQVKYDKDKDKDKGRESRPPGRGWHEHKHSWPGSNENQAWYQDGKIYYRSSNYRTPNLYYSYQFKDPVSYAKSGASWYGLDAARDQFRLLTVNSQRALVEVQKQDTGKLYNMLLERTSQGWQIVQVKAL